MKKMCAFLFAAVACVGLALAADFTWIGNGSTTQWTDAPNWEPCPGEPCPYPDGTNDTSLFPDNSRTTWTVTQEDQGTDLYGDVTIEENVDFDGDATLDITALIIDASALSSNDTIVVTVTDPAGEVKANG